MVIGDLQAPLSRRLTLPHCVAPARHTTCNTWSTQPSPRLSSSPPVDRTTFTD